MDCTSCCFPSSTAGKERALRHYSSQQHVDPRSHPERQQPHPTPPPLPPVQEIPVPLSHLFRSFEEKSLSYLQQLQPLSNIFYYLVPQWLSLSVSSPPRLTASFSPQGMRFFSLPSLCIPHRPLRGQNKVRLSGTFFTPRPASGKSTATFTAAFLDVAFSTCLQPGCELSLDISAWNLLEPCSQKLWSSDLEVFLTEK